MQIDRELTPEERSAIEIINTLALILTPIEHISYALPNNETIAAAIATGLRLHEETQPGTSEHALRFTNVAFDSLVMVRWAVDLFKADMASTGDQAEAFLQHLQEKDEDAEEA